MPDPKMCPVMALAATVASATLVAAMGSVPPDYEKDMETASTCCREACAWWKATGRWEDPKGADGKPDFAAPAVFITNGGGYCVVLNIGEYE